jgi:hypothetical protein
VRLAPPVQFNQVLAAAEVFLSVAAMKVVVSTRDRQRGRELEDLGFRAFDALHVACAESGGASLLSTLKRSATTLLT